ncbi:hypothetical protein BSKO_05810 [Bryopsis sp. KO-2023]|nr:hypothetical protein BSKO_05810 [Bryopsis sp. KO-2023]
MSCAASPCESMWIDSVEIARDPMAAAFGVDLDNPIGRAAHVRVLELAPGGTLRSFINSHGGSLREAEARWFFQQIILAVDYAHKMGVFFRDIKLENIVMGKNEIIMLCDLGFSKCTRLDTGCNTFLGTPRYIAPELHEFLFSQNLGFRIMDVPEHDGKALDLFAAGVCLHVMIYGEYPEPVLPGNLNRNLNIPGPSNPLKNLSYKIPSCSKRGPVSEDCQNLIAGLLCPDPKERLTTEGILSHPWFVTDLPKRFHGFNKRAAKKNVKKVLDRKLAKCPVGPLDIEGRSGAGRLQNFLVQIERSHVAWFQGKINRSSCQTALSAENREGHLVAIKRMGPVNDIRPQELEFAKRELRLNKILNHRHIVKCIEHFYSGNELFTVLEPAPDGTLRSFVDNHGGSLPEAWARQFFQQIILAVDYAHKMGVFFRDINLENIRMGRDNNIMLCDLGCSKCTWFDVVCNSLLGTPYIAPELLHYCMFNPIGLGIIDALKALDLFAAGVCLFVMIYGESPELILLKRNFNSPGPSNPLQNLSYSVPRSSPRGTVPENCRDLIGGLLRPDPKERLTMEGILSHPWFMTNLPEGFHGFNKWTAKRNVEKVLAADLVKCPVERQRLLNIGGYQQANGSRIENNESGGVAKGTTMVPTVRGRFGKVGLWMKKLLMCCAF